MDEKATSEKVAREHYGKLVAYLATSFRDISLAEEGLADAFVTALEIWPLKGIPHNPEGWLFATAKRKIIDKIRHNKIHMAYAQDIQHIEDIASSDRVEFIFPDERLKLMFVCAHPSLDDFIHTPLMLQTILGFDAKKISSAFLTSPTSMSQRLVRAKNKIKNSRIPFEIPDEKELPSRQAAVLSAIYALYNIEWEEISGSDLSMPNNLSSEAIYLSRLMTKLTGNSPEALGLYALLLFCEARKEARFSDNGDYQPLYEQNIDLWNRQTIKEAEAILQEASISRVLGRFQIEAAIQSAHTQSRLIGEKNTDSILTLYRGLLSVQPTIGAKVAYSAALLQNNQAQDAMNNLDQIDQEKVKSYQPYWVTRLHVCQSLGRINDAMFSYKQCLGLTANIKAREYLSRKFKDLI